MKFGEVYDYRNAEEAKQFIGKKGVFSDSLWSINKRPAEDISGTLVDADGDIAYRFIRLGEDGRRVPFQFFRPILEEDEPLMTRRQLAEWLAKGNGEYTYETSSLAFNYWQYSKGNEDNKPVGGYIHIRRWKDTEWMKPTKDIYEEDCKC